MMPPTKRDAALEIDQMLGKRLREIRNVRGMTQNTLGKAVKISFQQVQKYERGMNRISVSTLVGFCNALGVGPMTFLGSLFEDDDSGQAAIDLVDRLANAEWRLKAISALANNSPILDTTDANID